MKIVLVNPPYFGIDDDHLEQHLGLAYLSSSLLANGFPDTEILELTGQKTLGDCCALIPKADAYGFTCFSTAFSNAKALISYVKTRLNPDAYIFIGGPHPSAFPVQARLESGADLSITGEGERAVVRAMKALKKGKPLRGVLKGEPVEDIDTLPYPTRLLDEALPFTRTLNGKHTLSMLATRGCPNRCVHCNSNIMGAGSRGIRSRSVENIIGEICELKQLGYSNFRFNDDNFMAHKDIEDLLLRMAEENIEFRVFSHVEYLTDRLCGLLVAAGCKFVSVGIESMDPDNLRFLGKAKNLKYIDNLENARKHEIRVRASFMVGLPYDNDVNIERYFKEASELYLSEFAVYPLIPYPGTMIYEKAKEFHYRIISNDYERFMQMGTNGDACFALEYDNPETGNRFGVDDVKRWKARAEEILGSRMIHMRDSLAAK